MATVSLLPEIAELAKRMHFPELTLESLHEYRKTMPMIKKKLSDEVERTDYVVDETTQVTVRVHRPLGFDTETAASGLGCLYSIHGGGYVVGSCDMDDHKFDSWCKKFAIVGVSVEYRLAPETSYPGPLEDCYSGLKWIYNNARELGIDPNKIGIAGSSAGGGLCAAVALLARDRGEIPIQFQLLECPMLDDRQITSSSQLDNLLIWSKASNTFGWKCYLGDLYGTDKVPPMAAVARVDDLSGLPEAYVCVGGADGFRDESIIYAMRLYEAGVPTELHVYPGAPHGAHLFRPAEVSTRYLADQRHWLHRQFERVSANMPI